MKALFLLVALAIVVGCQRPANADEIVGDAYGVPVTQRDVDLHTRVGTCAHYHGDDTHPPDPSFWPEPCNTINRQYEETGAKKKYEWSLNNLRTQHLRELNKAIGQ